MKNTLKSLMSVAAAALALTSCSTDATDEVIAKGEPKTLKVNATIEQTRTTLAENHIDLQWSDGAVGAETAEGDKIYLYIGESATEEQVINPATGGTITAVYEDGDNVYANYSIGNSFSKGVTEAEIQIVASQEQTRAGVFAGYNLPMVAKGQISGNEVILNFKPVGCVLVFNVYGSAATDEKIQSISFETSGVGCYGYKLCNLAKEPLNYEVPNNKNLVKVELTTPAAIGTKKPAENETQTAENQVYLVVAPAKYPAGSKFTVTTDAGSYTFTTTTELDCSTKTARVVNLNLAKSPDFKEEIEVPTVNQLESKAGDYVIEGIKFKHFAAGTQPTVALYDDEALTQEFTKDWLSIKSDADLASGTLNYAVTANETTDARTAYIGIKCGNAQAAIAITQVGAGSTPAVPTVVFEEHFDGLSGNNTNTGGSSTKWENYSPNFSAAATVYQAGDAIKLGKSKEGGSITTKTLDLSGPITLEFKVKGWSTVKTDIIITVNNDQQKQTVTYTALMSDAFEQKTVQLEAANDASTITFSTSERAFIDDIVIKVTK